MSEVHKGVQGAKSTTQAHDKPKTGEQLLGAGMRMRPPESSEAYRPHPDSTQEKNFTLHAKG